MAARRNEKFNANREALINALKDVVGVLDQGTGVSERSHTGMMIALYRWAIVQLEASSQTKSPEVSHIHSVCTLLKNASHEWAQTMGIDRGWGYGPPPER